MAMATIKVMRVAWATAWRGLGLARGSTRVVVRVRGFGALDSCKNYAANDFDSSHCCWRKSLAYSVSRVESASGTLL